MPPTQPILKNVLNGPQTQPAEAQKSAKLALYVHWPWCLKKCPYCDFNSHVSENRGIPARSGYIAAICSEIRHWREALGSQDILSVFFGGGTPSLMTDAEIGQILAEISHSFGIPRGTEITVECNPTSANKDNIFNDLNHAGVNRVSVGVQGLSSENLTFLGRQHDTGEALQTLEKAQKTFKNVNADLIFGLPKQDLAQWQAQLRTMATLGLAHLSCYQLTIEPQTAFYGQVRRGEWQPLDADRQADFMEATRELLTAQGYAAYETSNYAKPGLACQHNLHIWRYGAYLGLGAGAHGRVLMNGQRIATRMRKDPADYVARIEAGQSALVEEEIISTPQAWREAVMVGLRLEEGIDLERLVKLIHSFVPESGLNLRQMSHLAEQGLLWQQGSKWGTTPKGALVLNALLEAMFSKA